MAISSTRIDPGSIELYFSGYDAPSLERVIFSFDPELGAISSIRGRSSGADLGSGNFTWSPAVKALALLLLKNRSHVVSGGSMQELPPILGESGSFASSLDYAFAKNPAWLSDMFGVSATGEPYAKSLILRTNPERKRPGPVTLALNRMVLNPTKIKVFVGELEVNEGRVLDEMAHNIKSAKIFSKGNRELRSTLRPASQQAASDILREFQTSSSYENSGNSIHYHYITTATEREANFLRCLHRRILDRNFSFIGKGAAQAWLDICESNEYGHYRQSLSFLDSIKEDIAVQCQGGTNIIGIRNGTGVKELIIAQAMRELHPLRISLVDGSQDMLRLSSLKLLNAAVNINAYEAEFMNPGVLVNIRHKVADENSDPATFLLLGNSLCVASQGEMIHRLREAMRKDDKLVLGTRVSLWDDGNSMEEVFSHWMMQHETPLFSNQAMRSLACLGITQDHGKVEFEYGRDRFFPSLYCVEHYFAFARDFKTSYLGNELYFAKGERILLSNFYQYSIDSVRMLLLAHGMEVQKEYLSEQGIQFFICKVKANS